MMNKKLNVAEDATFLFEQLKFDKSQSTIDKSTLQALLLYCDVDRVDSLFFNSLSKKIEEHKGDQINLNDFIKIFDFAKDPFPKMNTDELSQLFMMFNPSGREDITYNDFLDVYRKTPDFNAIVGEADALAKDFETIDPIKKAITPEEFLKILNTPNTQSQNR